MNPGFDACGSGVDIRSLTCAASVRGQARIEGSAGSRPRRRWRANIREDLSGGDPLTPSWDVVPRVRVDTSAGHFALRFLVAAHVVPGTIDVAFEHSETGERWTPVDPAPPSRLVGYHGRARAMEVVVPGITSPIHFAPMTVRLVADDPE